MPRQHQLPHTAAPAGPCDQERDAYMDAMESASEANSAKRNALQALLDSMLTNNLDRVAVKDPKTGRRKWLEITANPKLRAVKAEGEQESGGRRGRNTAVRSTEHEDAGPYQDAGQSDPFAATRGQMADEPENSNALPAECAEGDNASGDRPIEPGAAGELVDGVSDLRTASQQRRKRGGR